MFLLDSCQMHKECPYVGLTWGILLYEVLPHRIGPHSCQHDVLRLWLLQFWICQGSFLKVEWSLSWCDSRQLSLFQK